MIEVWYMGRDLFRMTAAGTGANLTDIAPWMEQGAYEKAAVIDSDNLEDAWRMMQNGVVTESWTLAPPKGLRPIMPPIEHAGLKYGNRSACMGDVFRLNGVYFVVAAVGFRGLPTAPRMTIRLNKAQRTTVLELFKQNPDNSPSYWHFRHRVFPLPGVPKCAMILYAGDLVGIADDGSRTSV